jgi:hypothetical protein
MSKTFTMSFRNPATQEQVEVRGEFRDDEWKQLLDFAQYAEDVERTSFFQDGAKINAHLTWDWKEGVSDESTLPSRPVVAELLHALRPIILQKEPTNFLRVCSIISKHSDHPYPREILGRLREHFTADPVRAGWTISFEDVDLNSEDTLNSWLNAYEYHRDAAKRADLERAHGGPPGPLMKALFLILLHNKAEAALTLAGMIRAMEKGGGTKFKARFNGE